MINEDLNSTSFARERGSVQEAFLNKSATVVTLAVGTKLFKLSSYAVREGSRGTLSPWWSPVLPFKEDKLGARGRYLEAKLNQVSMREMVRFASAIRVDWNDIAEYQEIKLKESAKCYWGQFAPQPS